MRVKNTLLHNGKRKVCRIFDSGPDGPCDRYTVAFKGYRSPSAGIWYPYLAASALPFHPQGFGQHGESKEFMTGRHLGKRIAFEACPPDVQRFILQNL